MLKRKFLLSFVSIILLFLIGCNLNLKSKEIIKEEKLPVFLQISGGTNENSYKKAIQAGININGAAIGSHARKILMPYLNNLDDKKNLEKAIEIAKGMVNSVTLK